MFRSQENVILKFYIFTALLVISMLMAVISSHKEAKDDFGLF